MNGYVTATNRSHKYRSGKQMANSKFNLLMKTRWKVGRLHGPEVDVIVQSVIEFPSCNFAEEKSVLDGEKWICHCGLVDARDHMACNRRLGAVKFPITRKHFTARSRNVFQLDETFCENFFSRAAQNDM